MNLLKKRKIITRGRITTLKIVVAVFSIKKVLNKVKLQLTGLRAWEVSIT